MLAAEVVSTCVSSLLLAVVVVVVVDKRYQYLFSSRQGLSFLWVCGQEGALYQ